MSPNASGEGRSGFDRRLKDGFWSKFVRDGVVLDIGYGVGSEPIFTEAIGLEEGTPNYNGRNIPYDNDSVATIHTSHLLEHIYDYRAFLLECFRALKPGGTLILIVPLRDAYENKMTLPSYFNPDHKRFYTSSSLLNEIESTLNRKIYKVVHLAEWFNVSDIGRPFGIHGTHPYEIECVLEKL
mgnify:CR=1 FL=1